VRWLTVPLGDVAEVAAGGGAPQDQADFGSEGYPFVRAGSLKALISGGDTAPLERLAPATAATHKLRLFPANTVLFAKSGMSAAIGLVHRLQWPAYVVNHLAAVMCGEQLDSAFLHHYLRAFSPSRLIQDAAYPSIRLGDIAGMKVPLPSIQDQRRIAAILDQADVLRAKRREALALLDELQRRIFIEMFGDPVTNERNWPTKRVSELCDLVRGSSPRPQGDPKYFGGPVPRLMVADITRDGWSVTPRIDSLTLEGAKRSRPVKAGTVVMAVSGNIGLVSRLAIDACVHDGFVAFNSLDRSVCEPGFLLALLHYSKAQHEKSKAGAIFINLTTTDIKAMRLPLPPLEMQLEFEHRLAEMAKVEDALRASQNELDNLFASLQHRAFGGEL